MPKAKLLLYKALLLGLVFSGCSDDSDDASVTPASSQDLREVRVEVKHRYQAVPVVLDSAVSDARITFYLSKQDRELDINPVATLTTSGSGKATIAGLLENYYYLTVTHDQLGTKINEVSTPKKSISFVEVFYP